MTINTQKLRDQLDIVHSDQCEDETQFEAAQQIIAAAPELLDRADRVEALDIIVRSVATALERHGVKDVDDPGEAIDVLVADKDREIARLRGLLADYDEAERALTLSGKVNKDLIDTALELTERIAKMEGALYAALPFVEDAEDDATYKPGAVRAARKQILAALAQEAHDAD